MDPKDLWVHEESKAMKDPVENRDFQAPREVQGQLVQQAHSEARVMQVPLVPRDHKAPLVKLERRVIQVLLEVKAPQALRGPQGPMHVTGNSAFLRTCTMAGTLEWSR